MAHVPYKIAQWSLRRLYSVWGGLEVRGGEKTPPDGPLIVATNHSSFWDPMALGAALDRPLHFMARKTLFDTPGFGWLIRQVNAFPLNLEGDSREALRAFGELLAKGEAVVLFPEGTRSGDGSLGEIKAGVGMLAVRNRAKVLPGYLWGTYQSWPRGRKFPKRHHIKAFFGEPITPLAEGESRKDAQLRVTEEVKAAIKRLEGDAWKGEPNPPPGVGAG